MNEQYLKLQLEQSIVDNCLTGLIEVNNLIISELSRYWIPAKESSLSGPFFMSTSFDKNIHRLKKLGFIK